MGRPCLSDEQVEAIKGRLAGGEAQVRIAADYGVTQAAISNISRGRRTGAPRGRPPKLGPPAPRRYDEGAPRVPRRGNRDAARAANLRYRLTRIYGTTEAWYYAQGDNCAICGVHRNDAGYKGLEVDHDHATGTVRGLLCHRCNVGIGLLRHNRAILEAADAYLTRTDVAYGQHA